MTGLIWATFFVAVVPLISLLWRVISKGRGPHRRHLPQLLLASRPRSTQPVGIYHAIIGTLLITLRGRDHLGAGRRDDRDLPRRVRQRQNQLAKAITFLVDVMTGIPSIVAGLFAFAPLHR